VNRLARGVPDARFYAFCEHRAFCFAIFGTFIGAFVLALGWPGLLLFVGQLAGFYLVVGWANSAGHRLGHRPFAGSATNRGPGLVPRVVNACMFGEWLHGYHHRYPARPDFGLAGEFDAGFFICRTLTRLGLADLSRGGPRGGAPHPSTLAARTQGH
jgi:fatty-acid desaturase